MQANETTQTDKKPAKHIEIAGMVVRYDRSGAEWLVEQDGRIVERLPPGAAGKEAAIEEAIHQAIPDLHQMARYMALKNPVLRTRIWKAAQLVANGHVLPARPGNLVNEVGQVISESDEATLYSIQHRDVYLCGCEDYQFEQAPRLGSTGDQKYCKHVLAFVMDRQRRQTAAADLMAQAVQEVAYAD